MNVRVCICRYLYVYIHMNMYTLTFASIFVRTHVPMQEGKIMNEVVRVHIYLSACMYIYVPSYL